MSMEYLFKPLKIGNMELKSRTGLAPMATGLDTNGEFSQRSLDFYEERAKGGVGFITVGVVTVDKKARYRVDTEGTKDQKNPGAWDDKFIPTWTKLADTVHKHGTKLIPQLFHPGNLDPTVPIAPSYVPLPTRDPSRTIIPKELSIDDIKQIEKDFADAAYRMKVAGCDGIQFHMSHGAYGLVAAFASPFLNKRTDEYGGNLEGRMRFPVECIREIRTKVGRNFPIIIRLSGEELVPGGRTIIETAYIANMLEKEGVDAIEVSAGTVPDSIYRVVPAIGTPLALNSDYSEAIKKVVNIPVLVVGNIKSPQAAEYLIETGKADGVVVGRGFLADPAWPNKAAAGKFDDIAYCSGCGACTKVGGTGRPITCV
ncbi:MAG: NADH:flavin oxidoreductase [Tissierellia bacterium]|nr:NADH:flavin oxidoreductase [Tissierellia bacterium]